MITPGDVGGDTLGRLTSRDHDRDIELLRGVEVFHHHVGHKAAGRPSALRTRQCSPRLGRQRRERSAWRTNEDDALDATRFPPRPRAVGQGGDLRSPDADRLRFVEGVDGIRFHLPSITRSGVRAQEESDVPLRSHGSLSLNRALMAARPQVARAGDALPVITVRPEWTRSSRWGA